MKFNQKGQIGIWTVIISAVASIFGAGITGYFTRTGVLDSKLEMVKTEVNSKIETVKNEQSASVLNLSQRVSVTETNYTNLDKKVDEVKSDVKELLRRVK